MTLDKTATSRKPMTLQAAYAYATSRCTAREYCTADMRAKLTEKGADADTVDSVLERLTAESYIDDARYATAYVQDKYRFNKWGRYKISQGLSVKGISRDMIAEALESIEEELYLTLLTELLVAKARSLRRDKPYDRRQKLIRFATGRGYALSEISDCLPDDAADEDEW